MSSISQLHVSPQTLDSNAGKHILTAFCSPLDKLISKTLSNFIHCLFLVFSCFQIKGYYHCANTSLALHSLLDHLHRLVQVTLEFLLMFLGL